MRPAHELTDAELERENAEVFGANPPPARVVRAARQARPDGREAAGRGGRPAAHDPAAGWSTAFGVVVGAVLAGATVWLCVLVATVAGAVPWWGFAAIWTGEAILLGLIVGRVMRGSGGAR